MSSGARTRRREKFLSRIGALFSRETRAEPKSEPPELDFYFVDDSRQGSPSRPGMGGLVAIGGISVPAESIHPLSEAIDSLCATTGFPQGEEFKWSPRKEQWMWANLVGAARETFFLNVLALLEKYEARVLVVVEDTRFKTATPCASPELDLTRMFLERIEWQASRQGALAVVIADRPGGGAKQDTSFLNDCMETLQSGTQYVKPKRIIHNVVSTPSHLSRLLQAADLVVGTSLARVSGELTFSPPIFTAITRLFWSDGNRIGGIGLKIHPDFRYCNLYHWLVGDQTFWKANTAQPFPVAGRPYSSDPQTP